MKIFGDEHKQMILDNEFIQLKAGGKIIYDTRWTYEEFLNGGPIEMEKEQIIKEIEETIRYNKAARSGDNIIELYKDATRKSNDVLSKARHYIKNNDEYSRGLDDAWEALKKIFGDSETTGLTTNTRDYLFGASSIIKILDEFTPGQVIDILEHYEKEQEEKKKLKLGDVVEFYIGDKADKRGVFLYDMGTEFWAICDGVNAPQRMSKSIWTIKKTGEHVDILGVLEEERRIENGCF